MALKIYHNPRCSKSRQTLALLEEKGLKPQVIEYLKDPPSPEELCQILKALRLSPQELVRKNEELYKTLELSSRTLSLEQWLDILSANPILIERPIVVKDQKAVLGRPPEKVLEIL